MHSDYLRKVDKKGMEDIFFCIIWTILKQRNKMMFEDDALNIQKWKTKFIALLWSWMRVMQG